MQTCRVCGDPRFGDDPHAGAVAGDAERGVRHAALVLEAACAPFILSTCAACGFSFNSAFDEGLLRYDESYDNDVPSATFQRYYQELSRMLVARFDLATGTVYDVGCGKGTFLKVLGAEAPGIQGVGVDPSCQPGIARARRLVEEAHGAGACVVWGMATKGVVFASLVGADRLAGGIDINPKKQGKFVPGTGLEVHHPQWLRDLQDRPLTLVVMNPNYSQEIRKQLEELEIQAQLVGL